MTCIVGIEDGKSVWMGGDSLATDAEFDAVLLDSPKVFVKEDLVIGHTGGSRVLQAMKHALKVPKRPGRGMSDEAWICVELMDAVRKALREMGAMHVKDGVEMGEALLIGFRGKLYEIEPEFAAIIITRKFTAIGGGRRYALGSLVQSYRMTAIDELSPRQRIEDALAVA